jgi:threonine/homoserine/homoserine lactone efflux protein
MTVAATAALFLALAFMAALPSVSVIAVSGRAAAFGFGHGALTALGIVVGDLLFILLALFGLAFLATALGEGFQLLRYLGAAWLIGVGIALWRSRMEPERHENPRSTSASAWASFLMGLVITLGDQKAILFYLGFLPAFVDLATLSPSDIGLVAGATVLAVGGVKLAYAWMASRAGGLFAAGTTRTMNRLAGGLLVALGIYLAFKPPT